MEACFLRIKAKLWLAELLFACLVLQVIWDDRVEMFRRAFFQTTDGVLANTHHHASKNIFVFRRNASSLVNAQFSSAIK